MAPNQAHPSPTSSTPHQRVACRNSLFPFCWLLPPLYTPPRLNFPDAHSAKPPHLLPAPSHQILQQLLPFRRHFFSPGLQLCLTLPALLLSENRSPPPYLHHFTPASFASLDAVFITSYSQKFYLFCGHFFHRPPAFYYSPYPYYRFIPYRFLLIRLPSHLPLLRLPTPFFWLLESSFYWHLPR